MHSGHRWTCMCKGGCAGLIPPAVVPISSEADAPENTWREVRVIRRGDGSHRGFDSRAEGSVR